MGLFDFVKDAGDKLFGGDDDQPETQAVRKLEEAQADRAKGDALSRLAGGIGISVEDLEVKFREGVASISGVASSQAEKEKLILLVGNTQGVAQVDDSITVEKPEPEATIYTVQPGDSLSKIAKAHYGDAMKYMAIFEANQPLLKDPNRIYPGQALRIPPQE